MRNPIRLKNLSARFMPFYLMGAVLILYFPPRPWNFVWALPFIVLGLALRSWGAGHLVKNESLTTSGPYAYVRHPLYVGTILVSSGFAVLFGGWIGIGLAALIGPWFAFRYLPRKERTESDRLEDLYGAEFTSYRASVPALWPRPVAWQPAFAESRSAAPDRRWALDRYSDNNELGTLIAVVGGVAAIWLRVVWSGS